MKTLINENNPHIKFFTAKTTMLVVLSIVAIILIIFRLLFGLGRTTNLSDNTPWGLWISFDVITGVALAAGGFAITFAAYIAGWEKYKRVANAATLTAFIGYLLAVTGVFLDLGKPFSIWHPLFSWQHYSVMFEIVICITIYTTVLFLEFLPWLLDKLNILNKLRNFLEKKSVILVLVILGIMLSYGHQSSLGGLFLLAPDKLHPLWYTHFIHHLFYLSAICAGLSVASLEIILSTNMLNKQHDFSILEGLARGSSIALAVYFIIRIIDLAINNRLIYIFEGSLESTLFLIEMTVGVILPMVLLSIKNIRYSIPALIIAHSAVIFGLLLNRFNVVFLTEKSMIFRNLYFPSWQEILITLGLISIGIVLYKLLVLYLPAFHGPAKEYPLIK
jgi:Ni/Fe-hydrogenase subunit HybB-like protein